jgi:hypothetical protein
VQCQNFAKYESPFSRPKRLSMPMCFNAHSTTKAIPHRFHSSFYVNQVIRQLLTRLPRLLRSSVATDFSHNIITNAEFVSQIFQTKLP